MCGIAGAFFTKGLKVSGPIAEGLGRLQHRGQDSSGMVTSDLIKIGKPFKQSGLVDSIYNSENLRDLYGHIGIGHNRYTTSGSSDLCHAQPIIVEISKGKGRKLSRNLALVHNGNLKIAALALFLEERNITARGLTDSEMMSEAIGWHLKQGRSLPEAIIETHPLFKGAYSVLAMTEDTLVAFRDPFGFKPLVLGEFSQGYMFASETCALQMAQKRREVQPGEMIVIDPNGLKSIQFAPATPKADVFEFVYLQDVVSDFCGRPIEEVRRNCGMRLAQGLNADITVAVPKTSVTAALAYSATTNIPMRVGLQENRYYGRRSFIEPQKGAREFVVQKKMFPVRSVLEGKKIALIDDSIVRGTTAQKLVADVFNAGAKEVHMLICSPPYMHPHIYGVDTPNRNDLIAACKSVEEIREFIGANSLNYLSLENLIESVGIPAEQLCCSIFNGDYPI